MYLTESGTQSIFMHSICVEAAYALSSEYSRASKLSQLDARST